MVNKKTILLIESNQALLEITEKILRRASYSVYGATCLTQAKKLYGEHKPDIVIMENNLSDGTGMDYCQEIRTNSKVPVIIISNEKDDELPALQAGANVFYKKPFDYEIFKAQISVLVKTANDKPYFSNQAEETSENDLQPESAQVNASLKKNNNFKRTRLTAAACLISIVIGTGIFTAVNNRPSELFLVK